MDELNCQSAEISSTFSPSYEVQQMGNDDKKDTIFAMQNADGSQTVIIPSTYEITTMYNEEGLPVIVLAPKKDQPASPNKDLEMLSNVAAEIVENKSDDIDILRAAADASEIGSGFQMTPTTIAPMSQFMSQKRQHYFKCKLCQHKCVLRRSIREHIRFHHCSIKPFSCQLCGHFEKSETKMRRHFARYHKEIGKDAACFDIDANLLNKLQTFVTSQILSATMDVEPQFTCKDCGYVTNWKQSALRHAKVVHLKSTQFACSECLFLGTQISIRQHMQTHHDTHAKAYLNPSYVEETDSELLSKYFGIDGDDDFNQLSTVVQTISKRSAAVFTCKLCSLSDSDRNVIKDHLLSVHLKVHPFLCTQCDFSGDSLSAILEHATNFHPGCEVGAVDNPKLNEQSSEDLVTNLIDVQAIELESDPSAPESLAASPQKRLQHKKLESFIVGEEDDKYMCTICSKCYASSRYARRHVRNSHLSELHYHCSQCDYRCSKRYTLKRHVANCHGTMREVMPPKLKKTKAFDGEAQQYVVALNPGDFVSFEDADGLSATGAKETVVVNPGDSNLTSHNDDSQEEMEGYVEDLNPDEAAHLKDQNDNGILNNDPYLSTTGVDGSIVESADLVSKVDTEQPEKTGETEPLLPAPKRNRGRPRKNVEQPTASSSFHKLERFLAPKRGRGRPKRDRSENLDDACLSKFLQRKLKRQKRSLDEDQEKEEEEGSIDTVETSVVKEESSHVKHPPRKIIRLVEPEDLVESETKWPGFAHFEDGILTDMTCIWCGHSTPSDILMEKHIAAKHVFLTIASCTMCQSSFTSIGQLKIHAKEEHPGVISSTLIDLNTSSLNMEHGIVKRSYFGHDRMDEFWYPLVSLNRVDEGQIAGEGWKSRPVVDKRWIKKAAEIRSGRSSPEEENQQNQELEPKCEKLVLKLSLRDLPLKDKSGTSTLEVDHDEERPPSADVIFAPNDNDFQGQHIEESADDMDTSNVPGLALLDDNLETQVHDTTVDICAREEEVVSQNENEMARPHGYTEHMYSCSANKLPSTPKKATETVLPKSPVGGTYYCAKCPFRSRIKCQMENHIRVLHCAQLKPFSCIFCNFSIHDQRIANAHAAVHSTEVADTIVCNEDILRSLNEAVSNSFRYEPM